MMPHPKESLGQYSVPGPRVNGVTIQDGSASLETRGHGCLDEGSYLVCHFVCRMSVSKSGILKLLRLEVETMLNSYSYKCFSVITLFILFQGPIAFAHNGLTGYKYGEGGSPVSGSAGTNAAGESSNLEVQWPMGTIALVEPQSHILAALSRYFCLHPQASSLNDTAVWLFSGGESNEKHYARTQLISKRTASEQC